MTTIICAILKKKWLMLVRAMVEIMPELMMDGNKIDVANLQTRLDPQIVFIVDVPCTGVADYVAIPRLPEQRSLPEWLRQRPEAQSDEEIPAGLHHSLWIKIPGLQQN